MMLEIGSYKLEVFPEQTKKEYAALPEISTENPSVGFFHYLLKDASAESVAFLEGLGIDPKKISLCRPLTEPDENGEILYLACAPLCARVLAGGDTEPRQSEETCGISVIFVGEENAFSPGLPRFSEPCAELRFVIPLPFDASYFEK
ncbi:MAG: hypothetical protein IJC26_08965 [Clostridia bacterium]|nr:hypothetical protein [Clostridia bacterium]